MVKTLIKYGLSTGLIETDDAQYAENMILNELGLSEPDKRPELPELPGTVTSILDALIDDAVGRCVCQDNSGAKERFAARLMGCLTARPSEINKKFHHLAKTQSIMAATDWFYNICKSNDYIKVDSIAKNESFPHSSKWGELEITINLSKPEKDPRDIANEKAKLSADYPKCMLCYENIGYGGRPGFPARQTLRFIPLRLAKEDWYLQYSPYLYYPEHCIVFGSQHRDMAITPLTFERLFDFLEQFPHYFIGSNADLPIVGGSILTHDHFQGGRHILPMQNAKEAYTLSFKDEEVSGQVLNWPMTALRLRSRSRETLAAICNDILTAWRGYSDEAHSILAYSGDIAHNTITPVARFRDSSYEIDLVLRNNRTSPEHPLGIFHPHANLHHIKKENIGLIEVMGLFILPGRLKDEMLLVAQCLTGQDVEVPDIHKEFSDRLLSEHGNKLNPAMAKQAVNAAIGKVCEQVLIDAGVFKQSPEGEDAVRRFLKSTDIIK